MAFVARPEASFLFSASPAVMLEFAKIASNVILNGGGTGKGYKNAAKKLHVTVEAVEQAILMLCEVFTRVARLNLSVSETSTLLEGIGFVAMSSREVLGEYIQERKKVIREAVARSVPSLGVYEKLAWRLDVQVSSRSLRNQAVPSFLLSLLTRTGGAETENSSKATYLEADYKTLKAVCEKLEQAVTASSSMQSRHVVHHLRTEGASPYKIEP